MAARFFFYKPTACTIVYLTIYVFLRDLFLIFHFCYYINKIFFSVLILILYCFLNYYK